MIGDIIDERIPKNSKWEYKDDFINFNFEK